MKQSHIFNSDVYHRLAMSFRCPTSDNLPYSLFGLLEEIGELIEKTPIVYSRTPSGIMSRLVLSLLKASFYLLGRWAKRIRKGKSDPPFFIRACITHATLEELKKELGDIHWMAVSLDDQFGFYTSDVNTKNIEKLTERRNTDTIITHTDH